MMGLPRGRSWRRWRRLRAAGAEKVEGGRGGEGRRRALELDGGERVAAGGENEGAGASTPVGLSRDTRARGWTQHCPVVKLDFSFSIRKG